MKKILKLAFSLLKCELLGEELDEQTKSQITVESAEELLSLSAKLGFAHIIAETIIGKKLLPEESKIFAKFKSLRLRCFFSATRKEYEQNNVYDALEKAKIPFIPLKGAVIKDLYPSAHLRLSGDLDVLIKDTDCQRAINVLVEQLSFTHHRSTSLHDYQLSSPGGLHLELHYTLMDSDKFLPVGELLKNIWDYSTPVENKQYRMQMSNEMFVFYHIAHMLKHFLSGNCKISMFLDLLLLCQKLDIDNEAFETLLKKSSLYDFYNGCAALNDVWFFGKEHNKLSQNIEEFILNQSSETHAINAAAISAIKGSSKSSSVLNLIFLDRHRMEIWYPILKEKPFLLPFYHIKRWFRIFNKKSRNEFKNVLNSQKSFSSEESKKNKDLFISLGLDSII